MELTGEQIKECAERLKKVEQTHKDTLAMMEQIYMALLNNSGNWEQERHNLSEANIKHAYAIKEVKDIAKDYNLLSVQAMTLYLDMTELIKTINDMDNKLVELINKEKEGK